ncbi:MAG: hypothetical protein R2867_33925 [Caldilineaceae bacterium]
MAADPLGLRVYSSRLLGGDPALVLHGGGKLLSKRRPPIFSVMKLKSFTSKAAAGIWGRLKSPALPLSVLGRRNDWPSLRRSLTIWSRRSVGRCWTCRADTIRVETILHAIIPFKFVDHSHADAVVTIMNTPNGEALIRELYGPEHVYCTYCHAWLYPGAHRL